MKTLILIKRVSILLILALPNVVNASYEQEVSDWQSHKDVANWLQNNFSFDKSRQKQVNKRLKKQGPSGLLVRSAEKLYEGGRSGFCGDATNFSITSLNEINPDYNARWVFIKNRKGRPNHWVAAFDYQDKLYIMDYGTGRKWEEMQGVHGPYDSLSEYRDFLASLDIPRFEVGRVWFREMPGEED